MSRVQKGVLWVIGVSAVVPVLLWAFLGYGAIGAELMAVIVALCT